MDKLMIVNIQRRWRLWPWRRELPNIPRIRNDLADLGEVEHDILDGGLARRATLADPAEHVAQGHKTYQPLLARGCEHGQLVKGLFAHGFDGFGAEGGGLDGGDGFEAEGADCGVFEGRLVF